MARKVAVKVALGFAGFFFISFIWKLLMMDEAFVYGRWLMVMKTLIGKKKGFNTTCCSAEAVLDVIFTYIIEN